jgi:CheY-like chemotaxis protein
MSPKYISDVNNPICEPFHRQSNSRQRILVVEDERDLRQITAEGLTDAGYQVDVAEDGATAWTALQIYQYDLLFTDQFMPKVSGVELLKKIHAARIHYRSSWPPDFCPLGNSPCTPVCNP